MQAAQTSGVFWVILESPTFWGAIIGFFGVIVTLAVNGVRQRADEARRYTQDRNKAQEDVAKILQTIRISLQSELEQLFFIMNAEKRFITKRNVDGNFAANFTWVPALEYFMVYRANLDKLGLLSDPEVKRLTYAVYVYQERIGYIARNGEMFQSTAPQAGGNISYELEDDDKRCDLINNLREICLAAIAAIREIRRKSREAVVR